MRNLGFIAASVLAAVMLAGCSGMELAKTQSLGAPDDQFNKGLFDGYLNLAKAEHAEGDYADSDEFAARAAKISGGQMIAPEEISMRVLPANAQGALSDARERLVAALDSGAREKAPAASANAQVMFDCWIQEQEENFQPMDIARCRDGFMASAAEVEEAIKPPPPPPPPPVKKTFVVYFPYDSDEITSTEKLRFQEVIDAAKEMDPTRIAITGHADTAGPRRYNDALAAKRMQVVAEELAKAGFDGGRMNLGSFGEMLPAAATGDGVPSQRNRRAEIEISR